MKALRPGPANRGPFEGAKTPQAPVQPFPAPIWETLVVQKTKRVLSRIKTKSGFIRPVRFTPPVLVQVFPEYLIPVIHTKSRKSRSGTAKFIKPVKSTGAATVVVHVKPIRMVSLVRFGKSKTRVQTKLGKPTKSQIVVVVVKPQRIRTVTQVANRRKSIATTKPKLSKTFGRATAKVIVRGPKVLSFANKEASKKKKFAPVRVILGKIPRTFGSSPVGSVIIFFDGLNVADGLTYHHGLSRPHITLVPAGGGNFFVTKDNQVTEEKSDSILKETYLIDGDIP